MLVGRGMEHHIRPVLGEDSCKPCSIFHITDDVADIMHCARERAG